MDNFLVWLNKYDLLIELIITVLTISMSLIAVFQTKRIAARQLKQEKEIAKQQAELQEKQIKISVYEQKNEINKVLNSIFDATSRIKMLVNHENLMSISQSSLYDLLNRFMDDVDYKNAIYTLYQAQFFLGSESFLKIRLVQAAFMLIDTRIECLDLLKDEEETRNICITEIRQACEDIEKVQTEIESEMIQELKLM